MISYIFNRFGSEHANALASNIFVTGGGACIEGMAQRIENEVRMARPFKSPLSLTVSSNPILSAW
jgi:actin-related protein